MSVQVKDNGLNELIARLKKASEGAEVSVGIHADKGSEAHEGGFSTVLEIGAIHELGLGDVPRRSFIADWADESQKDNEEELRNIGRAIIKGKLQSLDAGLERAGIKFKGDIQKRMTIAPYSVPLDPKTIARKGSSTALIDTGHLRSSIDYVVKT